MKKPNILVVGSFVMDLIVCTAVVPGSGETVIGKTFTTAPGGKGANQAVQAARLGAAVTMAGKVGEDVFGRELIASAQAAGIDTRFVQKTVEASSAVGSITIEERPGEKSRNRIIVVPGANFTWVPGDLDALRDEIAQFDMLVLQNEIPAEINEIAAGYAHDAGVPVMLNSAPSRPLSEKLLRCLTYISPNEHEAADITGIAIRTGTPQMADDVKAAVARLLAMGVKNVIITLGSSGAVFANENEYLYAPCIDVVQVVDPTAAGDSFVGSFCTGICAGLSPASAMDLASYAATLTVSRMGAQPSLPDLDETIALMRREQYTGIDFAALDILKN